MRFIISCCHGSQHATLQLCTPLAFRRSFSQFSDHSPTKQFSTTLLSFILLLTFLTHARTNDHHHITTPLPPAPRLYENSFPPILQHQFCIFLSPCTANLFATFSPLSQLTSLLFSLTYLSHSRITNSLSSTPFVPPYVSLSQLFLPRRLVKSLDIDRTRFHHSTDSHRNRSLPLAND